MLTVLVSGPPARSNNAQTALRNAGFRISDDQETHGLDHDDPTREDLEPEGFVTAEGDDLDAAVSGVEKCGWRLRLHHPAVELQPAIEVTATQAEVAALAARVDELQRQLKGKR